MTTRIKQAVLSREPGMQLTLLASISAVTMFAAGPVPELTVKLAPLLVNNNPVWCFV